MLENVAAFVCRPSGSWVLPAWSCSGAHSGDGSPLQAAEKTFSQSVEKSNAFWDHEVLKYECSDIWKGCGWQMVSCHPGCLGAL